MDERLEHELFTRDTLREGEPVVKRHIEQAEVDAYAFDLYVHVPGDVSVARETAFAIARELRGGRDHDVAKPADWHVRSLGPSPKFKDDGTPWPGPVATSIWFSQTFHAPDDYREDTTGTKPIEMKPSKLLSS